MPLYEFDCEQCGQRTEDLAELGTSEVKCPFCSGMARKAVSLCLLRMDPNLSDSARDMQASQRAWIETPEVQAKLKTGEYELGGARDRDESNGPGRKTAGDMVRAAEHRAVRERLNNGDYKSETECLNLIEKYKEGKSVRKKPRAS